MNSDVEHNATRKLAVRHHNRALKFFLISVVAFGAISCNLRRSSIQFQQVADPIMEIEKVTHVRLNSTDILCSATHSGGTASEDKQRGQASLFLHREFNQRDLPLFYCRMFPNLSLSLTFDTRYSYSDNHFRVTVF